MPGVVTDEAREKRMLALYAQELMDAPDTYVYLLADQFMAAVKRRRPDIAEAIGEQNLYRLWETYVMTWRLPCEN